MYTLESLEQELKNLGKTNFLDHLIGVKPLLSTLLNEIKPEDRILACSLQCNVNLKPGIIVVLQDRIIFMEKNPFIKKHTDIYLKNIASFQNSSWRAPMASYSVCSITITDNGGSRYTFSGIIDEQAARIIKVLNDKVAVHN